MSDSACSDKLYVSYRYIGRGYWIKGKIFAVRLGAASIDAAGNAGYSVALFSFLFVLFSFFFFLPGCGSLR